MGQLLRKLGLLLSPLLATVLFYLLFDPFEVLYRYDRYYRDPAMIYNWDHNHTEVLRLAYPRYRFDSFIFGSSRSKAFTPEAWQRCLGPARIFHYSALSETLFGVERKLAFLERSGIPVRNCLLVVDGELLARGGNNTGHLFIKHPEISGESRVRFHLTMFQAFMDPRFLFPYLAHKAGFPVTSRLFYDGDGSEYDPLYGDLSFLKAERKIVADPDRFFASLRHEFYLRPAQRAPAPPVVGPAQERLLANMARILAASEARVTVVISPLYDQIPLNPADVRLLGRLFGSDNVFDYSGSNRFTGETRNYYEPSHFRPHVAQEILGEVCQRQAGKGRDR